MSLEHLLHPRHPELVCHQAQLELLQQHVDITERARLAQQLRWGNATYCYYHQHPVRPTEADYVEWLTGLPEKAQATMRALGYEQMQDSLPLRRYVLEKNDIGLSDFLCGVLSAADWQQYQQSIPSALRAWLPPLE